MEALLTPGKEPRPAPYPADTRAKGWRFELDVEQLKQSDTWALAKAHVRPWLLMLWTVAWQQAPCGSLPADDELIVARLEIDPAVFAECKRILLRGWWLADDGRLYHDTITQRVLGMLKAKHDEAQRKRDYRDRKQAEARLAELARSGGVGGDGGSVVDGALLGDGRPPDGAGATEMSHGTTGGQTRTGPGRDATGTGTGTGTGLGIGNPPSVREGGSKISESVPGSGSGWPVDAGRALDAIRVCGLLRAAGMVDAVPGDRQLNALLDAGADDAELLAAASVAKKNGKGFAYAMGVAVNERLRAAELAQRLPHGPLVPAADADPDSVPAVQAAAVALGLQRWEPGNMDAKGRHEPWPVFKARVRRAQAARQGVVA